MSYFDFFGRWLSGPAAPSIPLLQRLAARVPPGGAPGLVPPASDSQADGERRLGERFAAELHAYGTQQPPGLARRTAAVAAAARRRRPAELEEALANLPAWSLPPFLEALGERRDLRLPALVELARALARKTESWEVLAAALALVGMEPAAADRELFLLAGRSTALTGVCAMAAEPLGPGTLLQLARISEGLGRAMALERLGLSTADAPAALVPLASEAFRLAGAIGDPAARAYAAVPLLEVADAAALLEEDGALAAPIAACLEAAARGGWNGGPGPGLGRLPGATKAAVALLASDAPVEIRRRAAQAVVDAHPMPPGPVRRTAEELLAQEQA